MKEHYLKKLEESVNSVNYHINHYFNVKINEMYSALSHKQAQFEVAPETPYALVELSKSIDSLQSFVKEQLMVYMSFLEEFLNYGQHFEPEKPSFGDPIDPSNII